jgi:hypothetical protein
VAGIAASSLLVAVGIYFLGNATSARAAGTTNRPNAQRHKSAGHQSIGRRGALNRELVRALSGLIMRRGGFTMSIVAGHAHGAGVTRDDSTCYALPLASISPTTARSNRMLSIPVGAEELSG